jgi:electron transport complex protein RnfC
MILNAVKLPHFNDSAEKKTVTPALPSKVIIDLWQNLGASCEPIVKEGDRVYAGQVIGDSTALVSVPVHASVSGTVTGETQILSASGKLSNAIIIKSDGQRELHKSIAPPVLTDKVSFIKAVRDSGSVGLGGAGFPTHVKLSYDKSKTPVNTLIINGAECEPFITGDYREIMENGQKVVEGIELVMKYLDISKTVIGIEKDKPRAIKLLQELCTSKSSITVKQLPLKFPQGAEKILIYQTTGKVIKEGELPLHAGCLVLNVSTVSFLADYMATGVPLITRRVTIDGDIVNDAKNVFVPVGTTLEDLVKTANVSQEPDKIVLGGPMMGSCIYDTQTPVTKTTGAVLLFGDPQHSLVAKLKSRFRTLEESACIRCGKCIHVCSMNLNPYDLNIAFDNENVPLLKKLKINLCMNCAACSYICPAKRNISERNQMAKKLIKK